MQSALQFRGSAASVHSLQKAHNAKPATLPRLQTKCCSSYPSCSDNAATQSSLQSFALDRRAVMAVLGASIPLMMGAAPAPAEAAEPSEPGSAPVDTTITNKVVSDNRYRCISAALWHMLA